MSANENNRVTPGELTVEPTDPFVCPWQTAYGLPGERYCGAEKARDDLYCAEHMADWADNYPDDYARKFPPTVPPGGGRNSWYLKDNGEWVRATVDHAATPGLFRVELAHTEPIGRVYDVPRDRVCWTEDDQWQEWNDVHWPEPQPVRRGGAPFTGTAFELAAMLREWPDTTVRSVHPLKVYAVTAGMERTFRPKGEDPKHRRDTPEHMARSGSDVKSQAFSGSETYAAGRMTHAVIRDRNFDAVQIEVVHDALMAAFQAGYLAAAEGISVDDLLARMASL